MVSGITAGVIDLWNDSSIINEGLKSSQNVKTNVYTASSEI